MKTYRIRYYFTTMQEGCVEANSIDEAREKAEPLVASWGWTEPPPEVVDDGNQDIEVTEVQ